MWAWNRAEGTIIPMSTFAIKCGHVRVAVKVGERGIACTTVFP